MVLNVLKNGLVSPLSPRVLVTASVFCVSLPLAIVVISDYEKCSFVDGFLGWLFSNFTVHTDVMRRGIRV